MRRRFRYRESLLFETRVQGLVQIPARKCRQFHEQCFHKAAIRTFTVKVISSPTATPLAPAQIRYRRGCWIQKNRLGCSACSKIQASILATGATNPAGTLSLPRYTSRYALTRYSPSTRRLVSLRSPVRHSAPFMPRSAVARSPCDLGAGARHWSGG